MSKREIANELHKPARRNFVRRRVVLYGKNDLFQADLCEMVQHARVNKGYKYLLTVLDCYTKYAYTAPLKSKTSKEVTLAMAKIFDTQCPKLLQVDKGGEFYSKLFDELIEKYKVKRYSTFSTLKASIVERFNRTLKTLMYREFTARGSHNWIDILPSITEKYNHTIHSSIGLTPAQANANPSLVKLRERVIPYKKVRFKIGDNVRISIFKSFFDKKYLQNWSTEVFCITKVNKTEPPTYLLKDYKNNPILGCFYTEELSKTNYPHDYLVEKIVRTKGSKLYVKWLGFPSTVKAIIASITMNVFGETSDTFINTLVSSHDGNNKLIRNNVLQISSITKQLRETNELASDNLSKINYIVTNIEILTSSITKQLGEAQEVASDNLNKIKSLETNITSLIKDNEIFKYSTNKTIIDILNILGSRKN